MIDFIVGYVIHIRDHLHFRKLLKQQNLPVTKEIGLFINKDGNMVYASPLLMPWEFYQLRRDLIRSKELKAKRLLATKIPANTHNWDKSQTIH